MSGGGVEVRRNAGDLLNEGEVVFERVAAEARGHQGAEVEAFGFPVFGPAGEHAAAERRVGDKRCAELLAGIEDAVRLDEAREDREFGLQRGDGVNLVRGAQRIGGHFGKPDIANLAFLHRIRHRADGFLDRAGEVAAVQVPEVDMVGLEEAQGLFEGAFRIFRRAIDAALAGFEIVFRAELGCDESLVAPVMEGGAELLLVDAHSVHLRRVEMIDAEIERGVEQVHGFGFVERLAVKGGHAHAAESDGVERSGFSDGATDHGGAPALL